MFELVRVCSEQECHNLMLGDKIIGTIAKESEYVWKAYLIESNKIITIHASCTLDAAKKALPYYYKLEKKGCPNDPGMWERVASFFGW